MFRIDGATAGSALPTPAAAGTPGFFLAPNPGTGTPGTLVTNDWLNTVQEEFLSILTAASMTEDKTSNIQVLAALRLLFQQGRLLNVQTFATPGVFIYTPTPGTNSVDVEVIGGGGAGGGTTTTTTGQVSAGGGGASGSYGRGFFRSGFSGAIVTIGSGGTAVAGSNGNSGGTSSFGGLISAPGGGCGNIWPSPVPPEVSLGGAAGSAAVGGYLALAGAPGANGLFISVSGVASGAGGSIFGGGGPGSYYSSAGIAASSPGGGGGGAAAGPSLAALAGGAGYKGIVIVREYA